MENNDLIDWSEPLINIKSLVRAIEDEANARNYNGAAKIARFMQEEVSELKFRLETKDRIK